MCINTASRARDGDPRSAPVALVGNGGHARSAFTLTACATSRERIAFLWSAPRRYDACATKVIVRGAFTTVVIAVKSRSSSTPTKK